MCRKRKEFSNYGRGFEIITVEDPNFEVLLEKGGGSGGEREGG